MKTIGLYLHIPFCRFLCHYCDFVKTANWDDALVAKYFKSLELHLEHWIKEFIKLEGYRIKSLFVGGGTPSLFTKEYQGIFNLLAPYLVSDAELTLEANPDNLTESNLSQWSHLGFNRLSIGGQSFCPSGLSALTRTHKASQVFRAYDNAQKYFDNINLDLIYGWKQQDKTLWQKDLATLISLDPSHISLYLLTYAPKTPMGRAHDRGKLEALKDEVLEGFYTIAREELSSAGYFHEEVSNWSKKNKTCYHNWLYWQDGYYIAIGAGACGYTPSRNSSFGIRYQYTSRERAFCSQALPSPWKLTHLDEDSSSNGLLVEKRSSRIWLLEYIGASLRSSKGVDLNRIYKKTDFKFKPSVLIEEALKTRLLNQMDSHLVLSPKEWFRESAWCLKIYECFFH